MHLSFDLFRNGWMVESRVEPLVIPRIREDRDVRTEMRPWATAVARRR